MLKPSKVPKTIDEYIKSFPKDIQTPLKKLREIIKKAAPESEEVISYQMPSFKLNGKYLVYFAAWKSHIGFYPMPSGRQAFKKELSKYKTSTGTAQFPLDKPLPVSLITKIVKYRVKEVSEKKKHTHYHKDGSVWAKGTLKGKIMEGHWEFFRKDGTKLRSGNFKNGKQIGKWTTYDKKGKVYKITVMK
jgi:uncharacterized protein YdhG (YjbR/CyaY superfamily)